MSVAAVSSVSTARTYAAQMDSQQLAESYANDSSFKPEAGALIADVWSGADKMDSGRFLAVVYNAPNDAALQGNMVQIAKSTLGLAANDENDVFEPPTKQKASDVLQNAAQLGQFAGVLANQFKSPQTGKASGINVAKLDNATMSELLSMVVGLNPQMGAAANALASGKRVVGYHDPDGLLAP
ncbi:MAG: hypothetical protein AAFX94_03235 [Myxococcota bacterium]